MQSFSNGVMTGVSSLWVMYRVSEANTSQLLWHEISEGKERESTLR